MNQLKVIPNSIKTNFRPISNFNYRSSLLHYDTKKNWGEWNIKESIWIELIEIDCAGNILLVADNVIN